MIAALERAPAGFTSLVIADFNSDLDFLRINGQGESVETRTLDVAKLWVRARTNGR